MMMAILNTTSYARSRSAKIVCSATVGSHRAHLRGAMNSRRAAVLLGLAGGMAIASPWNANALIPDGMSVYPPADTMYSPRPETLATHVPTPWPSCTLTRLPCPIAHR